MASGHTTVTGWSAGVSAVTATFAGLIASRATTPLSQNPWFIASLVVACIAFAILMATGIHGFMSWWRRKPPPPRTPLVSSPPPSPGPVSHDPAGIVVQGGHGNIIQDNTITIGSDTAPSRSDREIVDIDIAWVKRQCNSHLTHMQAQEVTKSLVGLRTQLTGVVHEVRNPSMVAFLPTPMTPWVFLYFEQQWAPRLGMLQRGQEVTIEGTVRSTDTNDVTLKECKIVDVKPIQSSED